MSIKYKTIHKNKLPKFLDNSKILLFDVDNYTKIPKDFYIKSLDVKDIKEFKKVFNAVTYFNLKYPSSLTEYQNNNVFEVIEFLEILNNKNADEQLKILKAKNNDFLYIGNITFVAEKEYFENFTTGVFSNLKDCIDSILIGLIGNEFINILNVSFEEILNLLNDSKEYKIQDSEEDLDEDLKKEKYREMLEFLKDNVNTEKDLKKIFDEFYSYSDYAEYSYTITKRKINDCYSIVSMGFNSKMVLNNEKNLIGEYDEN